MHVGSLSHSDTHYQQFLSRGTHTARQTEANWNEKLALHFYTSPVYGTYDILLYPFCASTLEDGISTSHTEFS